MKTFIQGSLAAAIMFALISAVAIGYLRFGFAQARADERPGVIESRLMNSIVRASIRHRTDKLQNPQAVTDAILIEGGKLYLNDCVGCHGDIGKPSDFGGSFYPPAPQFVQNELNTQRQKFSMSRDMESEELG